MSDSAQFIPGHDDDALEPALLGALVAKALEGDVSAIKFALCNLFPDRYALNPNAQKPSPLAMRSLVAAVRDMPAEEEPIPGAPPFKVRLAG